MNPSRQTVFIVALFLISWIYAPAIGFAFTDEPGKEGSFYSPIVRIVPDQGFILITTGSGILWVKASEAAKPHLAKLPVGGLIDLVVEFQGKPNPPIIKSWKLASGGSKCNVFDGTTCQQAEKAK